MRLWILLIQLLVEDVVENIADEILLKARDEVDEAVRRYILSVCSEPTLSTSVTVPKGEWLLMEALCVALDKQISKNEITITCSDYQSLNLWYTDIPYICID